MKNIIKFAVGNPVTICMVVFALLLLGKVSYDQLSVDLLPDLNNPRLFIELKAGERPPEEIEKQFVKNMESMAIRQSDVTQVSSVIKAGTARITVEYTWTKDMDEAFLDLQKAMNPFAQNKDITELKITQHDANLSPVVLVGMSHQSITDMAESKRPSPPCAFPCSRRIRPRPGSCCRSFRARSSMSGWSWSICG